jgi:hypothetical protein
MGMGLVATVAALVLGLLISSAKSFYDAQSAELTQVSARIILLDRLLAHYGPETKEARDLLRGAVADSVDRIWLQERTRPSELGAPSSGPEALLVTIQELSPKDDRQRSIQGQALDIVIGLAQTRWLMYEQGVGSVSRPMRRWRCWGARDRLICKPIDCAPCRFVHLGRLWDLPFVRHHK